ncbi:hypothetical protein BJ165DRAFT_1615675 [Panaeolus papilionaceus]|nr:hypothetical protein BJ165DRAFT_1615675 [Panaeolus papilionaceus]
MHRHNLNTLQQIHPSQRPPTPQPRTNPKLLLASLPLSPRDPTLLPLDLLITTQMLPQNPLVSKHNVESLDTASSGDGGRERHRNPLPDGLHGLSAPLFDKHDLAVFEWGFGGLEVCYVGGVVTGKLLGDGGLCRFGLALNDFSLLCQYSDCVREGSGFRRGVDRRPTLPVSIRDRSKGRAYESDKNHSLSREKK